MLASLHRFTRAVSSATVDKLLQKAVGTYADGLLPEPEVLTVLGEVGFSVSPHVYATDGLDAGYVSSQIPATHVIAKGVLRNRSDGVLVTDKSSIGGVQRNVPNTPGGIESATKVFKERFGPSSPYKLDGILFLADLKVPGVFGTELLVNGYQDWLFGPMVTYGFGGPLGGLLKAELPNGKAHLYIPSKAQDVGVFEDEITKHLATRLASGAGHLDSVSLLSTLRNVQALVADYSQYNKDAKLIVDQLEVNPAVAAERRLWALDGVLKVRPRGDAPFISAVESGKPIERIRCLTHPKSIIVAGASAKTMANPGSLTLANAKKYGVKEIYALHPTSKDLFGVPGYPDLAAVKAARKGEPVDLFTVIVPTQAGAKLVLEAYALNSARAIQILSAGWGETARGRPLEQQLRADLFKLPNDVRPVINGPNTVGNRVDGGINSTFVDASRSNSDFKTGRRNCAMLCQSGGFVISRISDVWPAVNPAVQISVGNQLDLSIPDFLEFYINDTKLTSFGMYIEGLSDGEGIRLLNLVRKARSQGQAVIIYKAGISKEGVRATLTHTASRAGDVAQFNLLLTQAGAMVVDDWDDWNRLIELTTLYPSLLKRKDKPIGVGVITNSGFEKGATADLLTTDGTEDVVRLTRWSPETRAKFLEIYKKANIHNVFDLHEVLDVGPTFSDDSYYNSVKTMLSDPACDLALVGGLPESWTIHTLENELDHPKGLVTYLKKIQTDFPDKPLICAFESGAKYWPLRKKLMEMGIPVFTAMDQAAKCLGILLRQVKRK
jgi:acyl-CoA synthetase (NDP forming)